jgi:hypothetical protein
MGADEISLTVEETNRIRVKLGLKPLAVDTEAAGVAQIAKQSAPEDPAKIARKLAEEKEEERTKRLRDEIMSGGSILDDFDISPEPASRDRQINQSRDGPSDSSSYSDSEPDAKRRELDSDYSDNSDSDYSRTGQVR